MHILPAAGKARRPQVPQAVLSERIGVQRFNGQQQVSRPQQSPATALIDELHFGRKSAGPKTPLERIYVLSDIHLNNHYYNIQGAPTRVRRPKVVKVLRDIIDEHQKELQRAALRKRPDPQLTLVKNGDIFDLTDSWPIDVLPDSSEIRRQTCKTLIDQIIANNQPVIRAMQDLLKLPGAKIQYVWGNHERWLAEDATLQQYLREKLGPAASPDKLVFTYKYYHPGLKLMAVHGDEFDPNCISSKGKAGMSMHEGLDILVVKRLMAKLPDRLRAVGYTQTAIDQVDEVLKALEYVKPVQLVFKYAFEELDRVAKNNPTPPGAPSLSWLALDESCRGYVFYLHKYPLVAALAKLPPGRVLEEASIRLLTNFFNSSLGRETLIWQANRKIDQIRANHNQLRYARRFLEKEAQDKDIDILALGHTHKILDDHVTYTTANRQRRVTRVVNTGSYKLTVLYGQPAPVYPAGLLKVQRTHRGDVDVDFHCQESKPAPGIWRTRRVVARAEQSPGAQQVAGGPA